MFYSFILSIKFYFGNSVLFQVWSVAKQIFFFFILCLDKFLILDDIFEVKHFLNVIFCIYFR